MKDIKERRYTRDHEWVDFYMSYAITGVSSFKLTGIREIDKIIFIPQVSGFIREGTILAAIFCGDYQIMAHMPIDGYIIKVNDQLNGKDLLGDPEGEGWIAIITPWDEEHKTRLLTESYYTPKYKGLQL
jgi:glycine cleavage system H lipoate-binding protein